MKLSRFVVLIIILLLFTTTSSYSQNNSSRGIPYFIASVPEENIGFFSTSSFLAELGVGVNTTLQSQAWTSRVAVGFTFYSFTKNDHIVGTIFKEVTGERSAEVPFNPNTSRWEEYFGYSKNTEVGTFSFGYTHFCKHEIDNFDPPFSDPITIGDIQKRVVILGGITGGFQTSVFQPNTDVTVQFYGKPHYNVVRRDYRYTKGLEGVSMTRLRGTFEGGTRANYTLSSNIVGYTKAWGSAGYIDSDNSDIISPNTSILFNGRIELGLQIKGTANQMDIFAAYEQITDDFSYGAFAKGSVTSVGLRIKSPTFF